MPDQKEILNNIKNWRLDKVGSQLQEMGDLLSSSLDNKQQTCSGQCKTCTTVKMVVKYEVDLIWCDARETPQGWTDQMLIGIIKAEQRKSKHGI